MNIITFDSIDSTNVYAKTHIRTLPHGSVIRARYQTAGKGQLHRKWVSNANENILFSLVLKPTLDYDLKHIEWMTIQTIIAFLASFSIDAIHKIPNDILVDGKKIAGMLIESKYSEQNLDFVIIGIGLNINQTIFPLIPNATSLSLLTNHPHDIDTIFNSLIGLFEKF
jgi:BirA family transcriptional regulator, biotin operon repressor / biotin---[acetyl-CoA-carboxylase] ligase